MTTVMDDIKASPRQYFTWRGLAIVAGVSLAVRLMLFVAHSLPGPDMFHYIGGDSGWWLDFAKDLYHIHDFSTWQLGARPPLFPLTIDLVYALGGSDNQALLLQTLFGAATPVLGYLLAGRLLTRIPSLMDPLKLAIGAGVVMALDPVAILNSVVLMAEPLFNLLFVACLLHLTFYIQSGKWQYLAMSGLWMILSMWTRNTTIYFWVVTPVILFLLMRRWWRPSLVLTGFGLVIYLAWSYRNLVYTGVFTYSLQTNFQLLFLRAVSAEHLATGESVQHLYVDYIREIYRRIGDLQAANGPLGNKPYWDFLVAKSPQIYAEMGRLAVEKLLQYWLLALLGTGNGLLRMFILTRRFPHWVVIFDAAYRIILYSFMVAGAWVAWVRRERELLALTGIPIVYTTVLTMISQVSAVDTRMATPILTPIIILSTAGFAWVWPRIKARLSRPAKGPMRAQQRS